MIAVLYASDVNEERLKVLQALNRACARLLGAHQIVEYTDLRPNEYSETFKLRPLLQDALDRAIQEEGVLVLNDTVELCKIVYNGHGSKLRQPRTNVYISTPHGIVDPEYMEELIEDCEPRPASAGT